MQNWDKKKVGIVAVCAIILIGIVWFVWPARAAAADKGGPPSKIAALIPSAEVGPWTNLWIGLYGTHAIAEDGAGTGQLVSPAIGFNIQSGKLVFGGEVSYGWAFGDLDGNVLELTGRVGVLPTRDILFYGHGGWGRQFAGWGDLDFWQFGPGIEFKTASGFSVDLRYSYVIPEQDALNVHAFRGGLKYNF